MPNPFPSLSPQALENWRRTRQKREHTLSEADQEACAKLAHKIPKTKKCPREKAIEWAVAHINFGPEKLTAKEVPSLEALSLYQLGRLNPLALHQLRRQAAEDNPGDTDAQVRRTADIERSIQSVVSAVADTSSVLPARTKDAP